MILKKDIEKLAALSRMKLSDEETERFAKEIDSILGYVTQIQEVADTTALTEKLPSDYPHRNALREDVDDRDIVEDTKVLIDLAPASQDGYVKVKKILG